VFGHFFIFAKSLSIKKIYFMSFILHTNNAAKFQNFDFAISCSIFSHSPDHSQYFLKAVLGLKGESRIENKFSAGNCFFEKNLHIQMKIVACLKRGSVCRKNNHRNPNFLGPM
jgi:hypothetical protein